MPKYDILFKAVNWANEIEAPDPEAAKAMLEHILGDGTYYDLQITTSDASLYIHLISIEEVVEHTDDTETQQRPASGGGKASGDGD